MGEVAVPLGVNSRSVMRLNHVLLGLVVAYFVWRSLR
jgi:hypothetical protein